MFEIPMVRGALLIALGALEVGAQDAEALRASRRALADSVRASLARVAAAEVRAQTVPDSSIEAAGVTLRFPSHALPADELRRITSSIEVVAAELESRYGPDGAALLAGDTWTVAAPVDRPVVNLQTGVGDRFAPAVASRFPIDRAGVQRVAFARAAQRALATNTLLREYVGGSFSLEAGERTHYFTLRTLVTSGSGPARRCARGVLGECRNILDPTDAAGWYDDGDLLPGTRSAPVAGPVRASLLKFALETGGPNALQRLRSEETSDRDALDAVAAVAGVPADTLIARWQAHLAGVGHGRAEVPFPLAASTLAWAGILMILATRRRGS